MLHIRELPNRTCESNLALKTLYLADEGQQGVRVPDVLRKYIPGAPEHIDFTRELRKDSTSQKSKDKSISPAIPDGNATQKMGRLKV